MIYLKNLERLTRFKPGQAFVDCYRNTMTRLDRFFSSPGKYIDERHRIAAALASELGNV